MSRQALADVSAAAAYVPTPALEELLTSLSDWVRSPVDTAVVESAPGAGTTLLLHVFEARQRGLRPVWFSPFLHIEAESLESWLAALAFGASPPPKGDWLATLARPTAPPPLLIVDDAHAASPAALDALAVLRRERAPRLRICLAGCRGPALTRAASVVASAEPVRLALPTWTAPDLVALAEAECANPALDRATRTRLAALDFAALASAASGSPRLLRNALMLRSAPVATTAAAAAQTALEADVAALASPPVAERTPPPEPVLDAAEIVAVAQEPAPELLAIIVEPAPETTAPTVAAAATEETDAETQLVYLMPEPEPAIPEEVTREPEPVEVAELLDEPEIVLEPAHEEPFVAPPEAPQPEIAQEPAPEPELAAEEEWRDEPELAPVALELSEPAPEVPLLAAFASPPLPELAQEPELDAEPELARTPEPAPAFAPLQLELPFDRVARAPEPPPLRVIEVDLAALPEPVVPAPRVEVSAPAAPPGRPRRSWAGRARRAGALAVGFGAGFAAFMLLTRPEPPPEPVAASVSAPPPTPATPVALHEVQINAQPWATIRMDGESVGVTPLLRRGVPGGEHEFEATFPDGRQERRTVRISPESRFVSFR